VGGRSYGGGVMEQVLLNRLEVGTGASLGFADFVLAAGWAAAPFGRELRHPGRRSAHAAAPAVRQSFKAKNRFLNLVALFAQFSEYLRNVHRSGEPPARIYGRMNLESFTAHSAPAMQ
jgi:hypothetical protein